LITKQDLQEYYWTKRNVAKLEQRLEELFTMATSITASLKHDADSIHAQGTTSDKVGNLVAEMELTRADMGETLEQSYCMLRRIEQAIQALPARETYLIRARYIEHKSWEQIAVDMSYAWAQVHRIHASALNILADT